MPLDASRILGGLLAPAVIAAYLGAYGPAGPEAFNAWLLRNRLKKTTMRAWFADMGDALTTVDADGEPAYILTAHADELAASRPGTGVRLLGAFDQYILGPRTNDTRILPAQHRESEQGRRVDLADRRRGRPDRRGLGARGHRRDRTLFPEAEKPPAGVLEAEAARVAQACGLGPRTVRID